MPRIAKWIGDAMEDLLASKIPVMKVLEIQRLSPKVKRIRFKGNLSGMNFYLGYAVAVRVSDTEYRNYTPSYSDASAGILEIVVHLHGSAPGSNLMDALKPGDELRISMPRGRKMYDSSFDKHVFFGDETSLGLALAFYTTLKNTQHHYHFYFELDECNTAIPKLLGFDNYTILPKSLFLSEAFEEIDVLQSGNWLTASFILTGNAQSVQKIRQVLKRQPRLGKIHLQAYWAEGRTGL